MERREFAGALLAVFCGIALPQQREQVWVHGDGGVLQALGMSSGQLAQLSTDLATFNNMPTDRMLEVLSSSMQREQEYWRSSVDAYRL